MSKEMPITKHSPVGRLDIGARAISMLWRAGIKTVGELVTWSGEEILRATGGSRRTIGHLELALAEHNLCLREPGTTKRKTA